MQYHLESYLYNSYYEKDILYIGSEKMSSNSDNKNAPISYTLDDLSTNVTFEENHIPFTVVEELKVLRTNIEYSNEETKVILLTSSKENEGKSTISFELCKSMAELGKKILLIDADMRKSVIHTKVIGTKPKGLSYYLSGQSDLLTVLCKTNTPNLYCITAGRVPPNPAELLLNKRMQKLISWARETFDYVIIDTPPINLVVDASIIATFSDASIVVIKSGSVPRKQAQNVIKQLNRAECPILGVVLNNVQSNSNEYGKKYGYGYYGDKPDERFSNNTNDSDKN